MHILYVIVVIDGIYIYRNHGLPPPPYRVIVFVHERGTVWFTNRISPELCDYISAGCASNQVFHGLPFCHRPQS